MVSWFRMKRLGDFQSILCWFEVEVLPRIVPEKMAVAKTEAGMFEMKYDKHLISTVYCSYISLSSIWQLCHGNDSANPNCLRFLHFSFVTSLHSDVQVKKREVWTFESSTFRLRFLHWCLCLCLCSSRKTEFFVIFAQCLYILKWETPFFEDCFQISNYFAVWVECRHYLRDMKCKPDECFDRDWSQCKVPAFYLSEVQLSILLLCWSMSSMSMSFYVLCFLEKWIAFAKCRLFHGVHCFCAGPWVPGLQISLAPRLER